MLRLVKFYTLKHSVRSRKVLQQLNVIVWNVLLPLCHDDSLPLFEQRL